jgi:hypothetical protein
MLLVIDSNMLRSPILEGFLSRSKAHKAVLCDYVSMEMYKGDPTVAARESMAILGRYATQVVILKTTGKVVPLRGRVTGLRRRLIDERQTRDVPTYFAKLSAAHLRPWVDAELRVMGDVAAAHFAKLQRDAHEATEIFAAVAKESFSQDDISQFRRGAPYTLETIERIFTLVSQIASQLHWAHPSKPAQPKLEEQFNTFIFRNTLCAVLSWIRWIGDGSEPKLSAKRVLNDQVDVNIATFGTYFDGVLSNDRRLELLYAETRSILTHLRAT